MSKHTTTLKRVASIKLSRSGMIMFAVVWVIIGYVAGSQAIDTGSWLMYLLAFASVLQVARFVRLSIKNHDNK